MGQLNEERLSILKRASPFKVSLVGSRGIYGSRQVGASLFADFLLHLEKLPQECVIPIDFSAVRFIGVSATDEFLCRILQRIRSGELAGRYVYVVNASPEVYETLDITLRVRELACLVALHKNSCRAAGNLGEPFQDTLAEICRRRLVTAVELADKIKSSKSKLNIICNRLNLLNKWGVVHRGREVDPKPGRQYSYHSIV